MRPDRTERPDRIERTERTERTDRTDRPSSRRRRALAGLAGLAGAAGAGLPLAARAQADRPVTIVVPYAPGGTTDLLGRLLAAELPALTGRSYVVENKPGAGSGLGAAHVARSAPDGQTLLVATSTTLAINPWLYRRLAYDPLKDFSPIGLIGAVPLLVVVNAQSPVASLADLVGRSRANPGAMNYGSAGKGSPQHLSAEMFKAATGAQLTHVAYRGSVPAITDLLGGQIQVMFTDIPPALAHVRSGRLRALAVTSAHRQPAVLDVAPVGESGVAGTRGFEAVAWQSLVGPAGLPRSVVDAYAQALARVITRREIRARLAADGFEPGTTTPAQFAAYLRSETERWGRVVRGAGLSPE